MNEQDVITPEIIDIQPAPVKGALAKTAWDSLPIAHRTSDNLQTVKNAVNHSGSAFLDLCRREGLQPDFSVIVVNHTENHYHTTHQGVDAAQIAEMLQQANQPLIEALRAQQAMQAPAHQGLTAEDVLALMQAQQAMQPTYYAHDPHQYIDYQPPSYQPPEINLYIEGPEYYNYNDVHPTVSASSHADSHSEQDNGYGGGFFWWFGIAWVCIMLLAIAGGSGD
jgi:hypothetical protein